MALLKNKLDGTPVVPIFIAEREVIKNVDDLQKMERICANEERHYFLPTTEHFRSENGHSMVSMLRYFFFSVLQFPSYPSF